MSYNGRDPPFQVLPSEYPMAALLAFGYLVLLGSITPADEGWIDLTPGAKALDAWVGPTDGWTNGGAPGLGET